LSREIKFTEDGKRVILDIPRPHEQVLGAYPNYRDLAPGFTENYTRPDNITGHTQRAFLCYWSMVAFMESGIVGVDLGSAGVVTPGSISVDIYGPNDLNEYGGRYDGVQIKADATHLDNFGTNTFSCCVSSHLGEHIPCHKLKGNETPEQKHKLACDGKEFVYILRTQWIRIVRPGGIIAFILPDEDAANRNGSSVFMQDPNHQHAFRSSTFKDIILSELMDIVDIIQYNEFKNTNFSFETVLRKK